MDFLSAFGLPHLRPLRAAAPPPTRGTSGRVSPRVASPLTWRVIYYLIIHMCSYIPPFRAAFIGFFRIRCIAIGQRAVLSDRVYRIPISFSAIGRRPVAIFDRFPFSRSIRSLRACIASKLKLSQPWRTTPRERGVGSRDGWGVDCGLRSLYI